MDLSYHYTHFNVRSDLGSHATDTVSRFGGSWNTYWDHPPGYGLDATSIDFWGEGGRGVAINEHQGDEIVAWLLGQHVLVPIRWLIWYAWWWRPDYGWTPYDAWQGPHYDHVHVTFA